MRTLASIILLITGIGCARWIPLTIDGHPYGKIRFSNYKMIKVEHAEDL